MMKKTLPVAALAAAMIGLPAQGMADDPVRIGSFLSASGPASYLGDPQRNTLRLFVDKINEDGGVLGRDVEWQYYDDHGEAGQARTFARRLIAQDQSDIVIGGTTTGATMAAVELFQRQETPFISLAGAVVVVDPVKEWVFKTPETDRMAARQVFADMERRGITKVGLISGTGGFGASGREQARDVADEFGIEIVMDETYSPDDSDMTAQLTRIRGNEDVEAIFNFDFGQAPAIVTRNYANLGIDRPLYQSHGVASEGFLELAGSAAEGVRLPVSPILVADILPEDDPQKAPSMDYLEAYEAEYEERPSAFGGYAYDALMIAVDAIERAGTTDPHAVRDALESTSDFDGVTGTFNMTPEDHMGLDIETSFRMVEIKDGTWSLIED
ncbi:ABC transporter substrate-binding protein [Aquisalimonas sp.]|uniref:ABC transporter substrate-binding protein n=1 Tax=unclassified Aquisalimonas TaxID=2644645 RepID=UPI0025C1B95F|nr:ABC transporter substrate-binding protein [Aquisalimonas sp.]